MSVLTKEQVEDRLMLVAENRATAVAQREILASHESLRAALAASEADRNEIIGNGEAMNDGPNAHCTDCGRRMVWQRQPRDTGDTFHHPGSWMCPNCVLERLHRAEAHVERLRGERDAAVEARERAEDEVGRLKDLLASHERAGLRLESERDSYREEKTECDTLHEQIQERLTQECNMWMHNSELHLSKRELAEADRDSYRDGERRAMEALSSGRDLVKRMIPWTTAAGASAELVNEATGFCRRDGVADIALSPTPEAKGCETTVAEMAGIAPNAARACDVCRSAIRREAFEDAVGAVDAEFDRTYGSPQRKDVIAVIRAFAERKAAERGR